ncbi:MAG: FkbM family methyltransferase [Mesorhizobium sp.]|uniref:FkbM family methyltransferase n=1 Tax=Mesorhizobium sp. TaxID=1871066 RepID=UPI000FE698C0|nr:FkbM family methyltransferase [Mesorhizobium sp.]RWM02090.1 MAG: FkbM family methyltransferase [Mesorhizobium sp.]
MLKELEESHSEFMLRWHLYRRWKKRIPAFRRAVYQFHHAMRQSPGGLFIDLGANIGDVARHPARLGMRVIAFEPDPIARAVLSRRFGRNKNVTIVPKAVGASARTTTFYQTADVGQRLKATEASSIVRSEFHENGTSFDVEVVDLVQFVRDLGEPVSIVKMDIEGAEAECLEALIDTGIYRSIGQVFVETHERFSPELDDRIAKLRERIAKENIGNINLDWR